MINIITTIINVANIGSFLYFIKLMNDLKNICYLNGISPEDVTTEIKIKK